MEPTNNQNAEALVNQTPVLLNQAKSFLKIKNFRIISILVVLILITLAGGFFISSKITTKPKTYSLTSKDLDKSINIKTNDAVTIETKTIPGLILKTQISDPSIVEGSEAYDEKTGKFIGKFVGKKKGSADIIVTGSPPCNKGEVCLPLEIVVAKNRIVVDK